MKAIVYILLGVISFSCGYTVLERARQADAQPLPDLIISDVRWQLGWIDHTKELWADAEPPDSPTPTLFFQLDIVNNGQALFSGSPSIAWSGGESDIAWGDYPRCVKPTPSTLSLKYHDTVTVCVTIQQEWYSFQPRLRFLVVTHKAMPQSKVYFKEQDDIPERDLGNNHFDLIRE